MTGTIPIVMVGYVGNDQSCPTVSYGPDNWARGAYYVDRLIEGASVADLPVEQVSTFRVAVNLKTANTLGIVIPQSVLLRADQVIR